MLYSVVLLICLVYAYSFAPAASTRLIFANRRDIRFLELTDHGPANETIVVNGLEDAISLDFDYKQRLVFWTDLSDEKIKSCVLGSKNKVKDVIAVGLKRPEGLAVDWSSKNIYWTDSETEVKGRIEVANFDGTYRKVLFWRDLDRPRGIAVDPLSGFMFWTDWGDVPKIERATMDGSKRKTIINTNIYWPNGVTIDSRNKRIYWVDARLAHIESSDLSGRQRSRNIVLRSLFSPFSISLHGNKLYWTDWTTRSIRSCNTIGHGVQTIQSNIDSPMGIKVFEPERQRQLPARRRYCEKNNGGCSHLCLLSKQGYSCACPTGVLLLSDKKTCSEGPKYFLLLATKTELRRISFDTPDYTAVVLPLTGLKHSMAVDFDPVDKHVYWSDDTFDTIKRARLDGAGVEVVASVGVKNPDGLAVDWIARNLYWTDTGMDRIEVSRLNGSSRKVLVSEGLREPRAIVLDPGKGYMFWTDWGKNAKIERADLDGGNRIILVNTSIIWPNGLAIDYHQQRLYWADAKLDKIEAIDFNGRHREIIINRLSPHVFGLTVMGDYLYWTDWQTRTVNMFNKRTGTARKRIVERVPDVMGVKAVNLTDTYGSNRCQGNNAGCSHLCFYRPRGVVCACPPGLELMQDQKTCSDIQVKSRGQVYKRNHHDRDTKDDFSAFVIDRVK